MTICRKKYFILMIESLVRKFSPFAKCFAYTGTCTYQSQYLLMCFHLKGLLNPFPNKPWFLRVCSMSLLKTLWEKEKLLVTSNFSFSHSVFYTFWELSAIFIKLKIVVCKLYQFGRVQNLSFGKGLSRRFNFNEKNYLVLL